MGMNASALPDNSNDSFSSRPLECGNISPEKSHSYTMHGSVNTNSGFAAGGMDAAIACDFSQVSSVDPHFQVYQYADDAADDPLSPLVPAPGVGRHPQRRVEFHPPADGRCSVGRNR